MYEAHLQYGYTLKDMEKYIGLHNNKQGHMYQLNNSVTFIGRPVIGSEEFLNQMVEALDITVDRCPKGRPRKMEN